ncbi:efflux RND transporter permease subunit [Clostridiaceae bacterium UIB06]|uniref:Efflux RND transporter permease subunit n=1 Tax=Clostridium thailandense TaxID=2794346 RepID=A0A949TXT5_9CLOT|nr:efflux RND transporter permease subunit [Clostridium thailandense]MBV7273826.1 efflux RND transporter permease subunit [Clostridium thailandense]MCH5136909.1 efflux RND transporter permease subunit [Clostridiaceae bacterium UIB06]
MKFFTKFSIRNAFVVLLAVILIVVGGSYSATSIKEESMPNISIPVVTIYTIYPGAAPGDVDNSITKIIQKSMSGIQGITDIKGISNENVSIVIAEFDYSADINKGLSDVQNAINNVTLPENVQKPNVSKVTMGSYPVMTYSIESNRNINDLTNFVNSTLQPELSSVAGVSSVDVKGLEENNIYIKLNEQKMQDNNITFQTVQNYINANNISYPIGTAEINQKDLAIRVTNNLNSIDNIKSIPIVVVPDASKIMADSLSKISQGMGQLGEAVGQLGQSMGQLTKGMSTTTKTLGEMIGNNTQGIAILNVIQKQEGIILNQQAILANPNASASDKTKANAAITQANTIIQSSANSLQKVLTAQGAEEKQLSQGASTSQMNMDGTKSNFSPSLSSDNTNGSSDDDAQLSIVFLKDIADISTSNEKVKYFTRSNFNQGMVLNIYETDDANTVQLAKNVDQKISDIVKDNKDIKFSKINDSSQLVKESVSGMIYEGVAGAVFAMIVIALFLRNLKSTIISVISIPLSVFIALIFLPRLGITLNTMSLGGIAVAVGRIVDDSIVVIENIYRRLSLSKSTDENKTELIEEATHEVGSAIAASTITTVGVFLPLSFISGLIGKVFIPFAYTVVICILASLLVALTVVPVMSKFMLNGRNVKFAEKEGVMAVSYKKVLNSVLNHRLIVLGLCLITLAASLVLLKKIGIQFMPSSNSNIINVKLTMPVGTSADRTNEEALKYEKYLKNRNDVVYVTSIIGDTSSSGSSALSNQSSNVGNFTVVLKEDININKAVDELIQESNEFNKNGESMIVTPQSTTGTQADNVRVIINGNNLDDITKAAGLITDKLKKMDTLKNVTNNISQKRPEISITVDPNKAANNGITPATAAGFVKNFLGFNRITTIDNGTSGSGTSTDVMLGYNLQDIDSIDEIKNLKIQGAQGIIKVSDIAAVEEQDSPATIAELNGNQYAEVDADIKISDTSKVTKEARSEIDSIKQSLPKEVTYDIQGSNQNITQGFSQMEMAMLVAITLVYIIMVITFGEPVTPFAILFSLPFAGVGAIAALFITNQPLTVSGMIGILMLIGIVVTNAIVLLDRVKTNRLKGMDVRESLLEAGSVRLRPILMTAISTVTALIPLAMGFSHGSLISQGLGIAVIGGLVFSTILTLIIVPIMYSILNGRTK